VKTPDGAVGACGRVWGTYIHGIFDAGPFRRKFLNDIRKRKGLKPIPQTKYDIDKEFDKLADTVRNNVDIKAVYDILNGKQTSGNRKPVKTGCSPATVMREK